MNGLGIKDQKGILVIALTIFGLYALGILFPDVFWGFHYPSFLPGVSGMLLLVAAVIATLYFQNKNPWKGLEKESGNGMLWRFVGAFFGFVFYYKFPIFNDIYGDALGILPNREASVASLDPVFIQKILSFDFTELKLGTATTYGLVGWISYYSEVTVLQAFRTVGAFCGAGYLFFMMAIIHRLTKRMIQRVLLTAVVFGAPLTLAFCGHIEIYAPVYFLLSVFWYSVIRYHEKPSVKWAVVLFILALLSFKFHVTGGLTLLIAVLCVVLQYRRNKGWTTSWKNLFLAVVTPVYLLGIYVYTMVTRSLFSGRSYKEDTIFDVIFLPLKSSEGSPLDRYNLFSPSHFFDYFNLWFLWSAGAMMLVVSLLIFYRKRVQFNHPLVQVMIVALLLYLPVFFVLNPLLSMAFDWDLMSIPGILMIVFSIILVTTMRPEEKPERSFESYAMVPIIGLLFLGVTAIFVNGSQASQGERLVSMGTHSFRTYWIGASTPVLRGIDRLPSETQKIRRLKKFIRDNEGYAIKGKDVEFSAIVNHLGNLYQNNEAHPDLELALANYKKAFTFSPLYRKNVYDLVVVHFLRKEFKQANDYIPTLVAMKYPNPIKALRIAIHTSIEAEAYEDAVKYCEILLERQPEDSFIQEVLRLLKTEEDKSTIKLKFRQQ